MAKVKIARKSIMLDMTAMCDVAFLLLTFFMLTTKFKPDEPVVVDTPGSISETVLSDADLLIITIDPDGKVFMGVDSDKTRTAMLEKMSGEYRVAFNADQKNQFRLTSTFGAPMAALPQIMTATGKARAQLQTGIPTDSLDNQLGKWVQYARLAQSNLYNNDAKRQLKIVVKADKEAKYETVKKVLNTLQDQNLNRFNLITNLEAMPEGFGKKKGE
jgi:biopolymer transport protein ExbD